MSAIRTPCAHVAAAGPRCECGHLDVVHDLARDNTTRKACSHAEGPKGTPCGCPVFAEEVSGDHAA